MSNVAAPLCPASDSHHPHCVLVPCTTLRFIASRSGACAAPGTPMNLCSTANEQLYPLPRGPSSGGPSKDVCFSMIEGDFQVPQWLWHRQTGMHRIIYGITVID